MGDNYRCVGFVSERQFKVFDWINNVATTVSDKGPKYLSPSAVVENWREVEPIDIKNSIEYLLP